MDITHEKSTHKAEVVQVFLRRHENADTLSVASIYGYECVVRTSDFQNVKLAVYFPPETLVPTERNEFKFLADKAKGGYARIKAKKIRGINSFGLLIPAPEGSNLGDNLYDYYNCQHFDAELDDTPIKTNTDNEKPPSLPCLPGKYDVDSLRRYKNYFNDGETVLIMEKIHGSNSCFVYDNGRMYAKSRNFWKKPHLENEHCLWWLALQNSPGIEKFCTENPGYFLYGEVAGKVKGFDYGCRGKPKVFAFDIMTPGGKWLDSRNFLEICDKYGIITAPVIGFMPFDFEKLTQLVECKTRVEGATHISEGFCIRPEIERWNSDIGRVHLKLVSCQYLERV